MDSLMLGCLVTMTLYSTLVILTCLLMTRTWTFFFFLVFNLIVFVVLGIFYVYKWVLYNLFGSWIGNWLIQIDIGKHYCNLRKRFNI